MLKRLLSTCGTLAMLGLCLAQATAQRPDVVWGAPRGNQPIQNGLHLDVYFGPFHANSFGQVTVRASTVSGKPSPVERRLQIRVGEGWNRRDSSFETVFEVVLPRGKREIRVDETLLPMTAGDYRWVETWEHGRPIHELSGVVNVDLAMTPPNYWDDRRGLKVLLIDRDVIPSTTPFGRMAGGSGRMTGPRFTTLPTDDKQLPDLQALSRLLLATFGEEVRIEDDVLGGNETKVVASEKWTLAAARSWYALVEKKYSFGLHLIHPDQLANSWRWYTATSLAVISWRDLDWFAQQRPARFQELRTWVRMGGRLVVLGDATPGWRKELAAKIGCQVHADWTDLGKGKLSRTALTTRMKSFESLLAKNVLLSTTRESRKERLDDLIRAFPRPVESGAVLARPAGWGWIYAADAKQMDRSVGNWANILVPDHGPPVSIRDASDAGFQRRSVTFWNGLIPGIGEVPVVGFVVMITLFSFVIGPLNFFWFTRRYSRTTLFLTIPAIALATTISFLVISVLHDGLSVRARIRSVTVLDQTNQESQSWSRQSYYAALAPNGLEYPTGTYVAPVIGDHDFARDLHFTLKDQDRTEFYEGDMIGPRRTAQVLVGNSSPTQRRLVISRQARNKIEVANKLGSRIEALVARDHSGQWYLASGLDDGRRLKINAVREEKARSALNQWARKYPWRIPRRISENYSTRVIDRMFGYDGLSVSAITSVAARSRLEDEIGRVLLKAAVRRGEYVAILPESPFVPLGLSPVKRSRDLEVVIGQSPRLSVPFEDRPVSSNEE